jgi:T-complex protein 1 subunit theta
MSTIVLRGSTNALLEDVERAIDDGVNTVKTLVKDNRMLAGAGATEIYLASKLTDFAKTQPGLDQYAMERFAQSFEVIPRTLAENAGLKPEAIIAEMYSFAAKGPTFGIDVNDGSVKDANEAEIWDALDTKTWGMKLTLDVVLTILKIDQIIMSKPSGGPNVNNQPLPPRE